MRKSLLIILFFLPLILFASKKPDWVSTNNSSKYPKNLYLIGIGIAPEQKTAEDRARVEIAKIFQSKIENVSEDYMKSQTVYVKRGIAVDSKESFTQKTKISTEKVLEGVQIVEIYRDKKNVYALAILDKSKMENTLLSKITAIDEEIHSLLKEIDKETTLTKIKRIKKSIDKLIERELLNKELVIVSNGGIPIPFDYSLSDLNLRLENLLNKELRICVDIKEDGQDGELRDLLIESINKAHFYVEKEKRDGCQMSIEGIIKIEPFNHPNKNWKWAKYEIDIKFVDQVQNKVIGTKNLTGEKSQLTYDSARSKAKNALKEKLLNEINAEVVKNLLE